MTLHTAAINQSSTRTADTWNTATFLAPWIQLIEALKTALGRQPTPEEHAAVRERWEAAIGHVQDREELLDPRQPGPFRPIPDDFEPLAAALRARPEFQLFRRANEPTVATVDLTALHSIQIAVINGTRSVLGDPAKLPVGSDHAIWNACFPPARIVDCEPEVSGSAITFACPDLDLRAVHPFASMRDRRFFLGDGTYLDRGIPGGVLDSEGNTLSSPRVFAGFSIGFGNRPVIVGTCAGRTFLSNGYDRCVAALRQGITRLPCVALTYENALAFESDHRVPHDLSQACWSRKPPLLRDFIDPRLGIELPWTPRKRIIRISVDEFTVPMSQAAI